MTAKKGKMLSLLAGTTLVLLTAGCTYPGDSSGYKAEVKPSKEKIQQQIAAVKANANMPESVRSMALKKLEKDLADAK
jgi:hypothetical protein